MTMIVCIVNVLCVNVFASKAMVSCQMLSELEEVIQYKLVPERRDIIRETWWERLQVSAAGDIWTQARAHACMHTGFYSLTCSPRNVKQMLEGLL